MKRILSEVVKVTDVGMRRYVDYRSDEGYAGTFPQTIGVKLPAGLEVYDSITIEVDSDEYPCRVWNALGERVF